MKTIAPAAAIRAEIQRRIRTNTWAKGYCVDCSAPLPYRIPHDGIANWTANVAMTAKRGCETFLLDVIAAVRQDYDLPAQSMSEVVADLLSSWRRS